MKTIKRAGVVLVVILAIIAATVVLTGAVEYVWRAPQLSETAQLTISPGQPVNTSLTTTLGSLKNKKVKLDVIKAQVGIVDAEFQAKIDKSQSTYDTLIGSISKPGYGASAAIAVLTAVGTWVHAKSKLYTPDEVKLIKGGETIL